MVEDSSPIEAAKASSPTGPPLNLLIKVRMYLESISSRPRSSIFNNFNALSAKGISI